MADELPPPEHKPAPVSILTTLSLLPSGKTKGEDLTLAELGIYLGQHYNTEEEKSRNQRHTLRDQLYRDGGVRHMEGVIDKLFKDPDVQRLRKEVVPFARFNNVIKRIVNEMSTVYSEPALRVVGETQATIDKVLAETDAAAASDTDEIPTAETPNNDKYQALLDAVCMDERMVEVGRLLNLHRALLVGFRVRQHPDGTREPTVDIATPANVRAIVHPNDASLVIGWLVRTAHKSARGASIDVPCWTLWTDYEAVSLREDMSTIPNTWAPHGLGVCPWVPVSLGPPSSGFWPGEDGEDLVAGAVTVWLENILLIKESKSATKQTLISGDGTALARGQAIDTERVGELADGQSATTVDMSMDLELFKGASTHVLNNLALNYGLMPAVTNGQHAESAEARELQMLPLRAIRRRQQTPLRRFELRFARVEAAVCKVDLPEYAFEVIDHRIEFAESETPLDPIAEQTLFEQRRAAGLDNTVDMIARKRPGLSESGAWDILDRNIVVETKRNEKMRPLMRISGSMGAKTPSGNDEGDGGGSAPPVPPPAPPPTTSPEPLLAK